MINWIQPKEYFAYGLQFDGDKPQLVLIGRSYYKPAVHHIARRHAYALYQKPLYLPRAGAFVYGRQVLSKVVLG